MTLVVKTNSYLSVDDADSYWAARSNSVWAASTTTTAMKEKALIEATQYLDGNYEFIGSITSLSQRLAWPRLNAIINSGNMSGVSYDTGEIPAPIEDATAELALLALTENLQPALERGGQIKKEKVDVIEVEYSEGAPSEKSYNFVSNLIKDLTTGGGHEITLERS